LIHRTTVVTAAGGSASALAAGSIVSAAADGIDVVCGDGNLLRLLEVQPEGRRAMTARDFLAGHHVQRGVLLESP
jgi:methionyl-tRNA formyltransferase